MHPENQPPAQERCRDRGRGRARGRGRGRGRGQGFSGGGAAAHLVIPGEVHGRYGKVMIT